MTLHVHVGFACPLVLIACVLLVSHTGRGRGRRGAPAPWRGRGGPGRGPPRGGRGGYY
jgi:hypothetical protein